MNPESFIDRAFLAHILLSRKLIFCLIRGIGPFFDLIDTVLIFLLSFRVFWDQKGLLLLYAFAPYLFETQGKRDIPRSRNLEQKCILHLKKKHVL